jgi:glucose-6-phosphate isomerase
MTDVGSPRRAERIPAALAEQIDAALAQAVAVNWAERIWARDATVWTHDDRVAALIGNRLGWLDLPFNMSDEVEILQAFAEGIRGEGFIGAVVCGMGGSSLAPEVLASALPLPEGGIPVRVLDSTDPLAVRAATAATDPAGTLYLIASKSGTTTETLSFQAHFWALEDEIHRDLRRKTHGEHFVAITDPGKSAAAIPHIDQFREEFLNPEDVGGRYSALSYVGLVPAALMGLNLRAILDDAVATAERCRPSSVDNPGLWLGVALATLARAGRDKLTLVIEPRYATLGAWIEQLVAESTGKHGMGIVPIDGEVLGDPAVYSDDRVFVRISSGNDGEWLRTSDAALDNLADAGHPVVELSMLGGSGALGGEFFRWEFATAVAGAAMGINPFDEPNVTESKDNTKRVLDEFRHSGALPQSDALAESGHLKLSGDAPLRLTSADGADGGNFAAELRRHLARCKSSGFIGIQAYVAPTAERSNALRGIAQLLRDGTTRAVTVGYGPRYLHSTGQLHKGGAPIGCFIQLTAEYAPEDDVPIPGAKESFATLIHAQAAGDFMSLESHDLPVISINLSIDPDAGLDELRREFEKALGGS